MTTSNAPADPTTALLIDEETRYSCSTCARCCKANWDILVSDEKKREIEARPWKEIGMDSAHLFKPGKPGTWTLRKKPGSTTCVLLGDDNLCILHKNWGEASKPLPCQVFPFISTKSDERVWISANYGCKAVQERQGRPLVEHREDVMRLFAQDLAQVKGGRDQPFTLSPGVERTNAEIDAIFDTLFEAMGDRLFPAMRQLAAFVSASPEPGVPEPASRPTGPLAIPGPVRYAFILSLYSDAIDRLSFWGRFRGTFVLPRMLAFGYSYHSRLLDIEISMPDVLAHPGRLPLESEALLLTLLRSRLRNRLVFREVAHAAAGITRQLLFVDAVLYFARALARGREIRHPDVLRGLEVVELYMSSQAVLSTLARISPQLPGFWQNPAVARGAAQMFTPEGDET